MTLSPMWLEVLSDSIGVVPLLPFLAALLVGGRALFGGPRTDQAERPVAAMAVWAAGAGLCWLLAVDFLAVWSGKLPGQRTGSVWLAGGGITVRFSFLLDGLSLSLATLVAAVGTLVLRFSTHYLHREAGFFRFFGLMSLFLAGMHLVVLAGNAVLVFAGWELCGIASFLLIGYVWQRPRATGNALFAFATNRAGDAGLLFSLGLAALWLGSFEWPVLLEGHLRIADERLLVLGFVLAALVKSAQIPFTPWIARALEGPTPSSAIFYGALMVHLGVFLLLRIAPLITGIPDVRFALLVVGGATAAYAWVCGLVQSDVKSALIYGTVFQVGLMVVEIALGWGTVATVHLLLHAAWRAWQFLLSPSWLAQAGNRPPGPPALLARWPLAYTAALRGAWLESLLLILMLQPTRSIAHDVRDFEERFLDRMVGVARRDQPGERQLVRGSGVAGRLLAGLAALCQVVEDRLALRGRGGSAEQVLRRAGGYLRTVEQLLEQPRYLMMAVMATFVVIL